MPFPSGAYLGDVQTALQGVPHSKTVDESISMTTTPHCYVTLAQWEIDAKSAADAATDIAAMFP